LFGERRGGKEDHVKIGIIGPGNMGAALARLWVAAGHEVMVSYSRSDDRLKTLAEELGEKGSWGSAGQAARFADVVVLGVPWWVVPQAIAAADGALAGKILIDVTNPVKPDYSGLEVGTDDSGGEMVQRLSGARVVKAYNAVFARLVSAESRSFGHVKPSLFYCGDDAEAKELVAPLIEETGFSPVDAGPLHSARYTEPLIMLYIELGRTRRLKPDYTVTLVER
jgi:predicted dinucleotide-binding enzyme